MAAVEIRDADAADAAAIAGAHTAAWQVAYRGVIADDVLDDPALGAARLTGWTRRLTDGPPPGAGDPENRILAGVLDGRVVGFGHVGLEADPPAGVRLGGRGEVYGFYLHPDAWGAGAADALMSACLDELRSRDLPAAVLWVLRANPRARRFYERWGWSATDRELQWDGPAMPGMPKLTEPVTQIEYHTEIT